MTRYFRLYISVSLIFVLTCATPVYAPAQVPAETDSIFVEEDERVEEQAGHDFLSRQDPGEYRAPEPRKLPEDQFREMAGQRAFWYANTEFKKPEDRQPRASKPSVPLMQRTWFQTILWLLIIGSFAAFLMIYLTGDNIGLFRRKDIRVHEAGDDETMPEDIFAINYQPQIDRAVAEGNFRVAIRLMYLRLLKTLAERDLIRYSQDKTNFDYLMQLHPSSYYADFFRVTRDYEYSWYGKFDINDHSYSLVRKDFENLESRII